MKTSSGNGQKKKFNLFKLLLGIIFWPISLSWLFFKSDLIKMPKAVKAGILAVVWGVLILLSPESAPSENLTPPADDVPEISSSEEMPEALPSESESSASSIVSQKEEEKENIPASSADKEKEEEIKPSHIESEPLKEPLTVSSEAPLTQITEEKPPVQEIIPAPPAIKEEAPAPVKEAEPVVPESTFFDYRSVPQYNGSAYVAVNDNKPLFDTSSITPVSIETYAPLDSLGRCGSAYACIGRDLMPTEERGSIGNVKPTGWHTVKYDCVDGKYLYNRCHLIGFQLTGENDNTKNLITGTRYLNIEGMLPFENMTADYIKETGNHVAYRSTPVFAGNELLARGVLLEGYSVEDKGNGIEFCVFAYNSQPDVGIDYATGNSWSESKPAEKEEVKPKVPVAVKPKPVPAVPSIKESDNSKTYVLNTNTMKFHIPSCSSVKDIKPENREDFKGSREEVISRGFIPCKRCHP